MHNYFVLKNFSLEVNDDKLCGILQVPEPEKVTTPPAIEQGGILQRWFPGWGGWYGSSQSEADTSRRSSPEAASLEVGEPPTKIRKNNEDLGTCTRITCVNQSTKSTDHPYSNILFQGYL